MRPFAKIVNGYHYICNYNYFRNIIFLRSLLYEISIMNFIKTGLFFTPEVFTLCKKYEGQEGGGLGVLSFDKTVFGINKASVRLF